MLSAAMPRIMMCCLVAGAACSIHLIPSGWKHYKTHRALFDPDRAALSLFRSPPKKPRITPSVRSPAFPRRSGFSRKSPNHHRHDSSLLMTGAFSLVVRPRPLRGVVKKWSISSGHKGWAVSLTCGVLGGHLDVTH